MIKKHNFKKNAGSTLIWALIMMLVLGILITGGLALAASYANRSMNQHTDKQSYYTALSMTKTIAEWLSGTSEEDPNANPKQISFINNLLYNKEGNSTTFDSSVDESLGTCQTTVSIDPETKDINITSIADYNGSKSTVNATLKNQMGSLGGGGNTGDYKLIVPDSDKAVPAAVEGPVEGETVSEHDGGFHIRRNIDIDFSNGSSFLLKNQYAPLSNKIWITQYYSIQTSNGNNGNYSLKLVNDTEDGFPVTVEETNADTDETTSKIIDRNMAVYGRNGSFGGDGVSGGNYNSFTIFTDDSVGQSDEQAEPPRKHIFILPDMHEQVAVLRWPDATVFGFEQYSQANYHNTHIQINDLGVIDGDEKKYTLSIPRGVKLTGKSSIYTRRDTIIGPQLRHGWDSLWYQDNDHNILKEDEPGQARNGSNFSPRESGIEPTTLQGTLIVADNLTRLMGSSVVEGDVIIKSTSTGEAHLKVEGTPTITGGAIYVKDGGKLTISGWYTNVYNDIFVEPGGVFDMKGGYLYGNVYLLENKEDDGKQAKMILNSQTFMKSNMTDHNGNSVMGGIYVGKGAKLERVAGYLATGSGTVHSEAGNVVEENLPDSSALSVSYYCDARVHANDIAVKDRSTVCTCGIAIPQYGNEILSWQVMGYSGE